MNQRNITREEFDRACEVVWSEIEYRNNLDRRTEDEAKDVPGFLTLLSVYIDKTKLVWNDTRAEKQENGSYQVSEALHGLRKLAGIAICSMVYCGMLKR